MKIYKSNHYTKIKNIYAYVDVENRVKNKLYTLIAGVNGVGKSSLSNAIKSHVGDFGHIVNPDVIAVKNHCGIPQAGREAINDIKTCIDNGIEFSQETTLSGHSIVNNINYAKSHGYKVRMFYVGISDANESIARIQNRVNKGGHYIPDDTVIRRYQKRFDDLYKVLHLCDYAEFYDNENGFNKIAEYRNGCLKQLVRQYPDWMQAFIDLYCD